MEEYKEKLFLKCLMELDKMQQMATDSKSNNTEYELQASKFRGIFELIEESGYSEEYEKWRHSHKTRQEVEG